METWTFGPSGAFTGTWNGSLVTVTVTSGGAFVASYAGKNVSTLAQAMAVASGLVQPASGGSGGGVTSFNGRTGAVTPQSGDYTAAEVGADASGAAGTAQSNAETYAASQASAAQSNAETYALAAAGTAQSNAEAASVPTSALPLSQASGGTGGTSAATARTALGLGTAAVQNVGAFAQTANNLSDLASEATARTNLGAAALQAVSVNFKPGNPTGTVSTSLVMMGLGQAGSGQSCLFTPTGTGKVKVDLTSQIESGTAAAVITVAPRWGIAVTTAVAAGSNGGEISTIATWGATFGGNGVLDVASIPAYAPTSGTLYVAASGSTTAIITYTGISGNTFTGCAYVSGSATGTVSTGGSVTTVPPNGVPVTGTRWGGAADGGDRPSSSGNAFQPYGATDNIPLTAGTAYWFDTALSTASGSDEGFIANVSVTFTEQPS